jgi:hypothetical protein
MAMKIYGRKDLDIYFNIGKYGLHIGPGVDSDSASDRNENQEYSLEGKGGRCVGLTTLPPSCADCLKISDPQTPGTLRASPGTALQYMVGRLRDWILNNMVRETRC